MEPGLLSRRPCYLVTQDRGWRRAVRIAGPASLARRSIGPVTFSVSSTELRSDAMILLAVAVIGALVPAWRAVRVRLLDAVLR